MKNTKVHCYLYPEWDSVPTMNLVATEIEQFQKDVQKLFGPMFHENLQNKYLIVN